MAFGKRVAPVRKTRAGRLFCPRRRGNLFATDKVGRNLIKPPALRPGDTVGVVASAAAVEREHLERGVGVLTALGYKVKVSKHALDRDAILAGTDRDRAEELAAYFADPEIRAVFGARGGYGCGRLLPLLDFAVLARTPKIFLGFSDATFLLNAIVEKSAMVCFHGPMVAMDFARGLTRRSLDHLTRLLSGEIRSFELDAHETVRPGTADGELIGGCLSVVVAMLGTAYAPRFDGRILFLEDTGEKAYRIDRMLVQLRQAGVLDRVAGIVFGAIRPVDGSENERALIARFVAEQTADLRCPVLFGIDAGHGTENLALPMGVRTMLDGARRRVLFMEPAVS
jgi:muramoyltetrapeptide carboxypeptidase